MAGDRGTIIHTDGTSWTQSSQATTYDFSALWASGPDDVWAVGGVSAIVHFDGKVWRDYSVPEIVSLSAVWGSAKDDVWAGGSDGAVYHFDGTAWTAKKLGTTADLRSLWGFAINDVWLGTSTGFLHYDGTSWSAVASPVGEGGYSTWGIAPNDIWSSLSTAVLHFDGTSWQDMKVPINRVQAVHGMWVDSAGTAYTTASFPGQDSVLLTYANGAWTSTSLGLADLSLSEVTGSLGGPVWIIGPRGARVRYDGQTFQSLTTDISDVAINHALSFAPNDVWVSGIDGLFHNTGSGWTKQALASSLSNPGLLWAPGPTDIWSFQSDGNVYRFNGSTWTHEATSSVSKLSQPMDAWGTVDDLYIPAILSTTHRVNGTWNSLLDGWLYGVYGTGPNDVWIVGSGREIDHWDGVSWNRRSGSSDDVVYRSVWGSTSNDFWLAGTRGNIYHYDGSAWTASKSGTYNDLYKIWGSGAHDVWAAGATGVVVHWDGNAWAPSETGTEYSLRCITGTSANDVWTTGDDGVILHRARSYRSP
jgi:hypothetical protein